MSTRYPSTISAQYSSVDSQAQIAPLRGIDLPEPVFGAHDAAISCIYIWR